MDVIKQIDYMIACLEMAKEEYRYKKVMKQREKQERITTGIGMRETGHQTMHLSKKILEMLEEQDSSLRKI